MKAPQLLIRPARPEERKQIFDWLAHSDITHFMMGPPEYPDIPIPSWEEFCEDFPPYFFNNSQPLKGRCFIIESDGQSIGQVNHDKITGSPMTTEFDIWMKDSRYTGKGHGTGALCLLMDRLNKEFGCKRFVIGPSARNPRAIKSYQKAGFVIEPHAPLTFIPDCEDAVYMVRQL